MNELEQICRPILTYVCNYWQFVNAGYSPSKEDFAATLTSLLEEAKEKAAKNPITAKDFNRIERPLIFFIDYTVKEGKFPFNREWRELARNYNELSGDEKFFDMLTEALDDPDSSNCLELFYTMIGLGFDGVYRSDPEYIERRMKVCAARFSSSKFDINTEMLTLQDIKDEKAVFPKPPFFKTVKFALLLAAVFMIAAFGINLSVFLGATADYRNTLFSAAENAIPKTIRQLQSVEKKPDSKLSIEKESFEKYLIDTEIGE